MKAVQYAISQEKLARKEKADAEAISTANKERHSGPSADRRVSLIKNILNKSER